MIRARLYPQCDDRLILTKCDTARHLASASALISVENDNRQPGFQNLLKTNPIRIEGFGQVDDLDQVTEKPSAVVVAYNATGW